MATSNYKIGDTARFTHKLTGGTFIGRIEKLDVKRNTSSGIVPLSFAPDRILVTTPGGLQQWIIIADFAIEVLPRIFIIIEAIRDFIKGWFR